ncbi:unnamed protein product [Leptosia nina]|uniref:Uncharacterized protein n=1 Tax=Leptosia nina TaxID=320188 RepID=A0AAV1JKP8_9NEOP
MLIIRGTYAATPRFPPDFASLAPTRCLPRRRGTQDRYYSKSRIVMSGLAEVGVIYDHGIPGTYINTELASCEKSYAMEINGKEKFLGEFH